MSRHAKVAWRKRNIFGEILTQGKLWIPEEIGRRQQRDDMSCESGTAEGKLRWKKPHQGHG
jgi:hypothetical protein